MAECILLQAGGGLDPDELTATAGDVLKGMLAGVKGYDAPVYGTLELTGTAADSQVLAGQTYYNTNAKGKRTGSMPNRGAPTASLNCGGAYNLAAGYYSGGKVTANSLASQTSANASAGQILSGYSAWVNGNKINGEMANRGGYGGFGNSHGNDAGNQRMWVRVPGGYYSENANVYLSWADIRSMAGLTADKLKKGVSMMGLIGSFQGFVDSPFYLFNKGTWNGLQTTGITKVWDGSTNGGGFDADANSQISLYLGGGSSTAIGKGQARFNSAVDLTPYKYLKAEYGSGGRATVYFGVSTNANLQGFSYAAYTSFQGQTSGGTYIIDISALSGNYYVYFGATDSVGQYDRTLTFEKVFLSNT